MLKLKIPKDVFEQMVRQARDALPIEACGILAGRKGEVEKLYEMSNIDDSSVHFMMKPEEQFRVIKDIRASGLKMLAIYHSHPGTHAQPSEEDVRLALTPDVMYIIISLRNPQLPSVKGFLINGDAVSEASVEVTPSVDCFYRVP